MTRSLQTLSLCALAGVMLFASVPAEAYSMIQTSTTGRVTAGSLVACDDPGGFVHWNKYAYQDIRWRLNTSGQGSGKGSAVQAAADAWTNVSGAKHTLVYDGTTAAGWATDGQNTIVFANGNGCTGGCLALTALVVQSGEEIIESDITFNAGYTWRTNGSQYDTQAVMTHEFGHALGIHHSAYSQATMSAYYFGSGARSLEADDVDALRCSQSRYGIDPISVTVSGPTSREPFQSGTWTCAASGGFPPYTRGWFKTTSTSSTGLGSGYSQTTSDTTTFNIVCDVWDSAGRYGSDFVQVDVDGDPGGPLPE